MGRRGVFFGNIFKVVIETPYFAQLLLLPNMQGMQSLKVELFGVKEQAELHYH